MTRNLLISLEGNIGSGKSTLLTRITTELTARSLQQAAEGDSCVHHRRHPPIQVLLEPVDHWTSPLPSLGGESMLQAFYRDAERNTFAFQLYILKTRLDQVLGIARGHTILSERCLHSHDAIFAEQARACGHIDDVQWEAYRGWVQTTSNITGEVHPAGVVYLRTSPELCGDRIRTRSRGGEAALPPTLLHGLHDAHERFVAGMVSCGVPVLTLDGDSDSSTMSEGDLQGVVRQVLGFVDGLRAENTKQC